MYVVCRIRHNRLELLCFQWKKKKNRTTKTAIIYIQLNKDDYNTVTFHAWLVERQVMELSASTAGLLWSYHLCSVRIKVSFFHAESDSCELFVHIVRALNWTMFHFFFRCTTRMWEYQRCGSGGHEYIGVRTGTRENAVRKNYQCRRTATTVGFCQLSEVASGEKI